MRFPLAIFLICAFMFGCVKRTISITSNPSGALVWVNDREVGRTPVVLGFVYYGEYDVRLEKDGQEPVMTSRWATSPSWDYPIIDVVVESFSNQESNVQWHFELKARNDDPELLLQRANAARESVVGEDGE
jgi:hypothetical protein